MLPSIAQDLDIPLASAGMPVSPFAIGMSVPAPLTSLVTLKMPRRPRRAALLGVRVVFIAAHVGAALVPHYGFLLVMRVLSAMADAGFWAMEVVVSGLSVATILGVPGGRHPARAARRDVTGLSAGLVPPVPPSSSPRQHSR